MLLALLALVALPMEPGSAPVTRPAAVFLPTRLAAALAEAGCMPAGTNGVWHFDVVGGEAVRWSPAPPAAVADCVAGVLPGFPRDMTHVTLVFPPRAH